MVVVDVECGGVVAAIDGAGVDGAGDDVAAGSMMLRVNGRVKALDECAKEKHSV